jgi:hypothetical protein
MQVNLVYYKNSQEKWVVDRVYALNHTARARASTLRKTRGVEAFVLPRTLRTNKGRK